MELLKKQNMKSALVYLLHKLDRMLVQNPCLHDIHHQQVVLVQCLITRKQ